jgi:hypothetical protein
MTPRIFALALLALAACPAPGDDKPIDDTGPFSDDDTGDTDTDTDTDVPCEASVLSMEPLDGATAVYYRDPLIVSFEGDGSSAAFTLTDAGGVETSFDAAWTEGGVQAELATVLAANTTYTLTVDVCGATSSSSFTTSSLGAPLTVTPEELLGRTYVFRLSEADITQPSFLDIVASSYLTVPLLISVTASDETTIDLIGGLGELENDGSYTQLTSEETWDFPAGDFSAQPYFEAYAESIVITFSGIDIPIEQFHLSGTFTADGSRIERGVGSGLGDSRNMGPLVMREADDYGAICEIAAAAGVECEPCSDGEPYCIYIVAEQITAEWEEGLTLVEVP